MKGTVGRSQLGLLAVVAAVILAACTLMLVKSTQASAQATAQPLLEYKFEEGSGNTAINTGSLGTAANGNIGGGATYSTDTPTGTGTGSSLDFFGGRIEVPPVCDSSGQCSVRHGQDQVTVEAWIKPDTFGGQRVVYDDYGNPGVLMAVWDDQVQFGVSTTTNGPAQGSLGAGLLAGHLEANKWQHIAGVYDGTGLRIYIDGQDTGGFAPTSGAIVSLPGSSAAIGNGNAEHLPFDGKLDDFRLFGVGLQPDQLAGGHFAVPSDTTKPTLDLPSDITEEAAGSDGAQVAYNATANDDTDGDVPVDCSPASGNTFPIGTTQVNCSATDAAGNEATGSFDVTVRDTTAPTISGVPADVTRTTTSASGAQVSYASPTASDTVDGGVPVNCQPASGSTFALGETTISCSASDTRANTATKTFKVSVLYDFGNGSGGGFAEPVTNGVLNQVKAGAGVPVKFGLGANLGLDIFAAGYPTSRKVSCDTQEVIDPIEDTVAVSSSGLKYDSASAQYIYNWKTDKAWSSTCRQLVIKLKDGSEHPINFTFK